MILAYIVIVSMIIMIGFQFHDFYVSKMYDIRNLKQSIVLTDLKEVYLLEKKGDPPALNKCYEELKSALKENGSTVDWYYFDEQFEERDIAEEIELQMSYYDMIVYWDDKNQKVRIVVMSKIVELMEED